MRIRKIKKTKSISKKNNRAIHRHQQISASTQYGFFTHRSSTYTPISNVPAKTANTQLKAKRAIHQRQQASASAPFPTYCAMRPIGTRRQSVVRRHIRCGPPQLLKTLLWLSNPSPKSKRPNAPPKLPMLVTNQSHQGHRDLPGDIGGDTRPQSTAFIAFRFLRRADSTFPGSEAAGKGVCFLGTLVLLNGGTATAAGGQP